MKIPELIKFKGKICTLIAEKSNSLVYQIDSYSGNMEFLAIRKDILFDMIIDGHLNDQYEICFEEKDLDKTYSIIGDKRRALHNRWETQFELFID